MRCFDRQWFVVIMAALVAVSLPQDSVHSQGQGASVSFTGQRAFVTGFTPIIGRNGGVGGIDVDANGVLKRSETQSEAQLTEARSRALHGVSVDVRRKSLMRKVSLQRLEIEIAKQAAKQAALGADILFLAGLQRIEYVFVYPEIHDIVVAGPAEDWVLRGEHVVGASSGQAVLRLDDLLDVLHSTAAAASGGGITCSIDPTEEGMARLQRIFQRRQLQLNDDVLQGMEQQLGDQNVTVTGIRPTSHFARVMVGADYMMKRLAMDLERSPVAGLPSYMQMLQRGSGTTQVSAPRWWLAPEYESVQKSEDGLAWRFHGRGIQAKSEHGYLNARGELVNAGRPSPLAKTWADRFTAKYEAVAEDFPVFSQLCGCVDLAVLAALLTRENLLERAGCPLLMLSDPGKLIGEDFTVPIRVPSQARAVRGRGGWVVSVSGGVDFDTKGVLDAVEENSKLAVIRQAAMGSRQRWWWD
jgi:hypothetical protein